MDLLSADASSAAAVSLFKGMTLSASACSSWSSYCSRTDISRAGSYGKEPHGMHDKQCSLS